MSYSVVFDEVSLSMIGFPALIAEFREKAELSGHHFLLRVIPFLLLTPGLTQLISLERSVHLGDNNLCPCQ